MLLILCLFYTKIDYFSIAGKIIPLFLYFSSADFRFLFLFTMNSKLQFSCLCTAIKDIIDYGKKLELKVNKTKIVVFCP